MYPILIIVFFVIIILLTFAYEAISEFLKTQENVTIFFIYIVSLLLFSIFLSGYFALKYLVHSSKSKALKDLIEHMSHFEQGIVERTTIIKEDGSCTTESIYEILGLTGAIEERTFRHKAFEGSSFDIKEPEFENIDLPNGVKTEYTILEKTKNMIISKICFYPGLESGQSAKILIREELSRFFKMKRSEIKNLIKEGKWELDSPHEFSLTTITMKTERLKLKWIFPKSWFIPLENINFDVTIGFGLERDWSEFLKIKENSMFTATREKNRIIVKLDVLHPSTGSTYWVLWKPPGDRYA